jgi:NAD(P)-dependent dehydrogenase (short-subunit alcohol dehydrogenase family)
LNREKMASRSNLPLANVTIFVNHAALSPRPLGRMINISSSSAQTGSTSYAQCGASKGAVIACTRALAIEFAGTGITANYMQRGFANAGP